MYHITLGMAKAVTVIGSLWVRFRPARQLDWCSIIDITDYILSTNLATTQSIGYIRQMSKLISHTSKC